MLVLPQTLGMGPPVVSTVLSTARTMERTFLPAKKSAGGMVPFARSKAGRLAAGDPRLSLEERYGTHDGYVQAVRRAAQRAQQEGFLLEADAAALIKAAEASRVLR